MTQLTALLLVGLCLASPILAYDAYEPEQSESYDAFYGYDDILSQRDIEIANDFGSGDVFDGTWDSHEYEIQDRAGPSYDDFYSGGIGLSYYDGYFEDEAPADCTEAEDGQYIIDGAVCDINVAGADAFLSKAGTEKAALDGTYKVAGCKNGLPRYALDAKDGAEARELWFSTIHEAWVFGTKEEEEQDSLYMPFLFSLDITTRPNFVRGSDWARDFEASIVSDVTITCTDSRVLQDSAAELYQEQYDLSGLDEQYDLSDVDDSQYTDGAFWEEETLADAELATGELYGANFEVDDDGAYSQTEDWGDEARPIEAEAGELPSDFQSAYARGREVPRGSIQEVSGSRNRKLSSV